MNNKLKWTFLIVIGLVIIGVMASGGEEPTTTTAETPEVETTDATEDVDATQAGIKAEDIVRASLKAPSTADFGGVWASRTVARESNEQNYFVVTGSVDSENGFGATIRTPFALQMRFTGGEWTDLNSWEVPYYKLGETVLINTLAE